MNIKYVICLLIFNLLSIFNAKSQDFDIKSAYVLLDGGSIVINISEKDENYTAMIDNSIDTIDNFGKSVLIIKNNIVIPGSVDSDNLKDKINLWVENIKCKNIDINYIFNNMQLDSSSESIRCVVVREFLNMLDMMESVQRK